MAWETAEAPSPQTAGHSCWVIRLQEVKSEGAERDLLGNHGPTLRHLIDDCLM